MSSEVSSEASSEASEESSEVSEVSSEASSEVSEAGEESESSEAESVEVMSYDEYMAAAVDDAVTIQAYVQAKQSYYAEQGTATVYLQDQDGAYFAYDGRLLPGGLRRHDRGHPGAGLRLQGRVVRRD